MGFFDSIFGGSKVPAAPDYSPLISQYNNIASSAQQNGQDAMAWAKGQVADNTNLTHQVNNGLLDTQSTFGRAADQRLNSSGQLLSTGDQGLINARNMYTDPNRKAADMGAAGAGAAQADDAARSASTSELESYGLNPGAVRYGGLDASARLQSAATRVGAENIAGRTDDALGQQANQAIVNQGNTEAGAANTAAGTAGTAGTGAVNTSLANTNTGNASLGTGLQWTGADTTALNGGTSATNTGFQNQADADKISNSSSSGLGTLAGLGLSAMGKGGALASGGALSGVGSALGTAAMAFLRDGGMVPAYDGGGAVPLDASPSHGAVTDDVPAEGPSGAIRLNGGEFVLPKDVVAWEGEKSLQNLIQKARQAKAEASAKPRVQAPGGPDPASPAFQPRPQAAPNRGALPV